MSRRPIGRLSVLAWSVQYVFQEPLRVSLNDNRKSLESSGQSGRVFLVRRSGRSENWILKLTTGSLGIRRAYLTCQSLTLPSFDADPRRVPSGLNAIALIDWSAAITAIASEGELGVVTSQNVITPS